MVDVSLIASAVSSIEAASDIAKGMKTPSDGVAIQSRVVDLQPEILDAQAKTLDAQASPMELLDEIFDLERKLDEVDDWKEQTKGYVLIDFGARQEQLAWAYVSKEGVDAPPHRLCTDCFSTRQN